MKRTPLKPLMLLTLPLFAGCSSLPDFGSMVPDVSTVITPYVIDVRQGNFVTQEMVSQLKLGMSRDQVRFVLGTPLLTDTFHVDRWDYVYRFKPGHKEPQQRRLAVFFVDGKLAKVDGDVVPATGAAAIDPVSAQPNRVIEIKPPVKPGDKPAEASAGKAADKPADKPTDAPAPQSAQK